MRGLDNEIREKIQAFYRLYGVRPDYLEVSDVIYMDIHKCSSFMHDYESKEQFAVDSIQGVEVLVKKGSVTNYFKLGVTDE